MRRSIARRRGQSSTDGGSPMDSGGEGSGTNRGFENYPGGMEGAAAVRPPWYRALTTGGLSPSDDEDGDDGGDDAASEEHLDPIQLPESTHSLLFTEPVGSLPFMYGFAIFLLSFACLVLAFAYNIQEPVPYNVTTSVRVAQYLSIVIAIVSEEEIPIGLFLLRMISKQSLLQKFPQMDYNKFVSSVVARIVLGYLFLANVLLVLCQTNGVIDIFYNALALQFVEQLDETAFGLAKVDVLGKELQRACTAKCFRAEFDRKRLRRISIFGLNRNASNFLKALYFINFCVMMTGMLYVSVKQEWGLYYDRSLTIDFGNTIWGKAWVDVQAWLDEVLDDAPSVQPFESLLVYSTFNGVFETQGTLHDGRPVYREMRKFDGTPYSRTFPASEIMYCKDIGAWVFVHPVITKSKRSKEEGCRNWLLRSPETSEFSLLDVVGQWQVWTGVISKAHISITRSECSDVSDCNLNGQCIDGKCICDKEDGMTFLGDHCEVVLRDECETIIGEGYNETWEISSKENVGLAQYHHYSRPVYRYVGGNPEADEHFRRIASDSFNITDTSETDFVSELMYTGDRWFCFSYPQNNYTLEELRNGALDYHGFTAATWGVTSFVSDVTTGSTPIGVDFYRVGERGEQFGPLGALYPIQKYKQAGRGYFRCGGRRQVGTCEANGDPGITCSMQQQKKAAQTERRASKHPWRRVVRHLASYRRNAKNKS